MAGFGFQLRAGLLAGVLLFAAASATADEPIPKAAQAKLVDLPLDCQKAYASMRACMEKTMAAGAPASLRPQWEQQLDDTLTSWQALKGQPGLTQLCRDIAANPECSD